MDELDQALTAAFGAGTDIRGTLGAVVELVGRALGVGRVFVAVAHDESTPAEVIAEWSDDPGAGVPATTTRSGRFVSLLERAVRANEAVVFDDVALDDRLLPSDIAALLRAGVRAAAIFPFSDDGRASGALVVHDTVSTRDWSATEARAVERVGRDVARVVRRSRELELERSLVERAGELDEERSEFVASVSHELRSPLTSILGYLELLRDGSFGEVTPEQSGAITIIEHNGRLLLGLIEDLLAVASVERSSFGVQFAPVDMHALIDAVLSTVAVRVTEGALTVIRDVPDGQCHALGDAEQLERALLNLVTNAVKFTSPGGTIRVSVRQEGSMLRVQVADTGIGVGPADREHVFERFFRAGRDGRTPSSGTGLGLFIVKTVIETHGGSVEFGSEPGVGTVVTCVLPAARVIEASDDHGPASAVVRGEQPCNES